MREVIKGAGKKREERWKREAKECVRVGGCGFNADHIHTQRERKREREREQWETGKGERVDLWSLKQEEAIRRCVEEGGGKEAREGAERTKTKQDEMRQHKKSGVSGPEWVNELCGRWWWWRRPCLLLDGIG